MNDLTEHWAEVIEARKELTEKYPDGVYLMSLDRRKMRIRGGQVCVAQPHVAALMIVQETHREATRSEIAVWKHEQEVKGEAQTRKQATKEAKVQINLGDFVQQLQNAGAVAPPPIPPSHTA